MPTAAISDAGSTSTTKLPSGRTSDSTAIPAASSSRPATIGVLAPKRAITRGARTIMPIMIAAVIGSSAAPPANAP